MTALPRKGRNPLGKELRPGYLADVRQNKEPSLGS